MCLGVVPIPDTCTTRQKLAQPPCDPDEFAMFPTEQHLDKTCTTNVVAYKPVPHHAFSVPPARKDHEASINKLPKEPIQERKVGQHETIGSPWSQMATVRKSHHGCSVWGQSRRARGRKETTQRHAAQAKSKRHSLGSRPTCATTHNWWYTRAHPTTQNDGRPQPNTTPPKSVKQKTR